MSDDLQYPIIPEDEVSDIAHAITATLVGEKLGEGAYRNVYAMAGTNHRVIKVEDRPCLKFCNVVEYTTWLDIFHCEGKEWLAPCYQISPCGRVLIQHRTQPVERHELPEKVPSWLTDFKLSNWGRIGKRIVCHDYAAHLLINAAIRPRLKKAKWGKPCNY